MYLRDKKLYLIILVFVCAAGIAFLFIQHDKSEDIPEVKQSALVRIATAKPQLMTKSMIVNGSITFVPESIWQVYAPGEVIVDQVLVHNSETIKKGQPLLKLRLSPTSSANLNNAIQVVNFAQKDYERLQMLRGKYLASNAEVQAVQQALIKATADMNSLKTINSQLNPVAKTDGIVINVSAQAGQIVPISTPLLSIGSNVQAQFNLDVAEKSKIKSNMQILVCDLNNMAHTIITKINNISGLVDQATGMVSFSASLPLTANFTPGNSVVGEVYLDSPKQQLSVPRSAILYQQNMPYVYINKNGVAQQKWVDILSSNESQVYISNGILIGDEVITLGNYELESGMSIRVEYKE